MWVIFFCLFFSFCGYICGSSSDLSSYQSVSNSSVVSSAGSLVRVKYYRHDPYKLYKIYRNKLPRPSHTKEWTKESN
jgi:hypothetical protein